MHVLDGDAKVGAWKYAQQLTPPIPLLPRDYYGDGLAMTQDGTDIFVGAPGVRGGAGATFQFSRRGTANSWSYVSELAPLGSATSGFGGQVGASGNGVVVAVGAPGTNVGQGSAYAFFCS